MDGNLRSRAAALALRVTDDESPEREALRAAVIRKPRRFDYARKKLYEAVNVLVGDGSIGLRLAYANQCLPRTNLPPELAALLDPIKAALRPNEDDPTANRRINPVPLRSRGGELAQRIFELYLDLRGGI
jgi:hypothetical protein